MAQAGLMTDGDLGLTYGPGQAPATASGEPLTPAQSGYATQNAPFRDPNAPAGSPTNPTYVTPRHPAVGQGNEVLPNGQVSSQVVPGTLTDADLGLQYGPQGQVVGAAERALPKTPTMNAALAAMQAKDYNQPSSTPALPFLSGVEYNFLPELQGAGSYLDTAINNAIGRLQGKSPAFGASDAYQADEAITRDNLAQERAQHPGRSALSEILGVVANPASRLGGGYVKDAFVGAKGLPALWSGMSRGALVAAPMGAVYGAGDNPQDRVGGAENGALSASGAAFAGIPVATALGGAAAATVNGARRLVAGPDASLGVMVQNVAPEVAQKAQELRVFMQTKGVDLSLPEAVQQVTNGGTNLGRSLRVLEGTPQGQQALAPYFAPRTQQVSDAVRTAADQIAPPTANPSLIGPQAQRAGQSALDNIRSIINAEAKPYYDAMKDESGGARFIFNRKTGAMRYIAGPGQAIPEDAFKPLGANEAYQEALGQIRGDPLLNAPIKGLPDNNVAVVNEVVKQLDRNATGAAQTVMNPGGNNFKAALYGEARRLADQIATEHSPQWRAARDIEAARRAAELEPRQAGPLGAVAGTDQTGAQVNALYPPKPLAGQSNETADALHLLGEQNPAVGPALTRQYILGALNDARPELNGGPNPYLGSAFAVRVAGTPERSANFLAGVRGTSPGGDLGQMDWQQMLEGLRATGRREPPGSKTAYNEQDLSKMGVTAATKAMRRIGDPLEWVAGIADLIDRANWQRNLDGLIARYTAPPEQTADIIARARGSVPPATRVGVPLLPYGPASAALMPPTSAQQ